MSDEQQEITAFELSRSDRDADWIKLIDGGRARERDLAAIDEAAAMLQQEEGEDGEVPDTQP